MKVLHSRILSRFPGLRHGTATLAFQPLTFHGHTRTAVLHARSRFLRTLGLTLQNLTLGRQVHGNRVRIIHATDQGSGAQNPSTYLPGTDALITQRPGIPLGIFTADCAPVLLHDPVTGWIGAIHAGWKGIVRGIVPKTLLVLRKQGVRMANLRVWVGPCICAHCYVTDVPARIKHFRRITPASAIGHGHHVHLDLRAALLTQLKKNGVQPAHVEMSTTCTKTAKQLPSARRQGKNHPNTLTVIQRDALPHDLRGKDVIVFGLGTLGGGVASVRYAAHQHAHVSVIDEQSRATLRPSTQALKNVPATFHFHWPKKKKFPSADVIIVNPGVSPRHPALLSARKFGTRITSDLALFRESSANPIIAVTGTKGKTTVATWLAYLLQKQHPVLAGNLQRSPLDIPQARDGKTPVVLEVSSFQLEHCDVPLQPDLGIVTNLYPDHLNRHGTMQTYARVKAKLFSGSTKRRILPLDSMWRTYAPKITGPEIFWTSDMPNPKAHAWLENGWIMLRTGRRIVRVVHSTRLHGQDRAMQRNAVTVALAGYLQGLSLEVIRKGLRSFSGVPQRFEIVRKLKGRTFINSTTATNPQAAITALESISGPCILLVGGASKHLPLKDFLRTIRARDVRPVLFAGPVTQQMRSFLPPGTPVVRSMTAAVQMAWRMAKSGDTILLAPGAASFGLFRNEFDRGEQFIRAVEKLR